MDDSENLCGKVFKKSGSCNTRLNHVIGSHPLLHDAVKEFRLYQSKVQVIELPPETDEPDVPSTPKRSRFEAARDEFIVNNMKQPLEYEEGTFIDLILKLITNQGVPFAVIQSDEFKALCGLLNPLYRVPDVNTLKRRLDEKVRSHRQDITTYISQHVAHGSITADGWMAVDKRKFLGITFHFLTPTFQLASVVIGMEHIEGPQTAETLLRSIIKIITFCGLMYFGGKY